MTSAKAGSSLHHVVFAIAPERHDSVAKLFTELGFSLVPTELPDLGLRISLAWDQGIELISPLPEAIAPVAVLVADFLDTKGDGIYTVVVKVPDAGEAHVVSERYGAATRFRQKLEGDGTHLEEIDLSVAGLPLTLLDTNIP